LRITTIGAARRKLRTMNAAWIRSLIPGAGSTRCDKRVNGELARRVVHCRATRAQRLGFIARALRWRATWARCIRCDPIPQDEQVYYGRAGATTDQRPPCSVTARSGHVSIQVELLVIRSQLDRPLERKPQPLQ
jgi:hypothetical protein